MSRVAHADEHADAHADKHADAHAGERAWRIFRLENMLETLSVDSLPSNDNKCASNGIADGPPELAMQNNGISTLFKLSPFQLT